MKVQVLRYTKKFFLYFSKTKWRRGSSHKIILLFPLPYLYRSQFCT